MINEEELPLNEPAFNQREEKQKSDLEAQVNNQFPPSFLRPSRSFLFFF